MDLFVSLLAWCMIKRVFMYLTVLPSLGLHQLVFTLFLSGEFNGHGGTPLRR
jgi:hypothetical protein